MKTITIEVDPEAARGFLSNMESQISEKLRARDELTGQIEKLELSAKKMRQQLQGVNGAGERSPRGQNRLRIIAYLNTLPGNAARMTQISKSTGISAASTSYTLKHNRKDFTQDENGLWKLK